MSRKTLAILFWASTSLFGLMMLFSGYSYLTAPEFAAAFAHLGFPAYFRIELGIAKALGALALLIPFTPRALKVFAYVGFAINLPSAFVAHTAVGDPFMAYAPMILIVAALLALSYITWVKIRTPLAT